MIIKELKIRNFKSFGNNEQTISLKDEGNLILLSGINGSGKSSLMDSFDYVFYNTVKGKKAKKVKLSSLPNRINSNLENTVEFLSDDGTEVKIVRGYKPNKLELYENGVLNQRAGKSKLEGLIENYIGIDYETFKSFISMSINDFKNFIALSSEDKRLLLDKLFNLEVINVLNKILNKLISDNKKDLEVTDREISIIEENINNIKTSIDKVKDSKKEDLSNKIELLTEKIESLKNPFVEVKEKLTKIEEKKKTIKEQVDKERTTLIETKSEIKQIDRQLELFANDQCPTCQTDLSGDFHQGLKKTYLEKKEKFEEIVKEVTTKGKKLNDQVKKLDELAQKGNTKYNEMNSDLMSLSRDKQDLLKKQGEKKDNDLDEFYESVKKLEAKKEDRNDKKGEYEDRTTYHKYLKSVFSDNGVKKSIINNIVDPINHYIHDNIQKMHLPFEVNLDDSFTAEITSFGEEIDTETLSTGETRKINIAIMVAYLRLIRTKRQINILFLDEVFSSIDVESIDSVIALLRDLANESKINIFLVHHSTLDSNKFDKVIKVEKNVFTTLEEVDISQ